jgi:hypothetical protein
MARIVSIQDVNRCPNLIISSEHWLDGYTCRCGDPVDPLMKKRGYLWSEDNGHWIRPDRVDATP